eukprot:TRINITY_DN2468_c0_g1_i1.p1 TRINITY_DN2468_c0_g1~~TRINITY_DN2468_c0_g1_i1.p1  ORF type:complete len:1523 (-),score=424.51 TRINITY_DN2468_c0_g1_i1:2024-6232(-)
MKLRYMEGLFHTYSGLFLVVVNPYKFFPIYSEDMINIYKGKTRDKVAPHIFAMADDAYREMLQTQRNQSMLITGESGAGKTENTKKVIQYLTGIAGRSGDDAGILTEQLLEFNPILEAFGNAKTIKNNNSSRFGKFIELQFNKGGQIAGANTRIYLLETSRVVGQAATERNFHIFYQMFHLSEEKKQQLNLTRPEDYNILNKSGCTTVDHMDDKEELDHSLKALQVLHVDESELDGLLEAMSAILHLGNLPFEANDSRGNAVLKDKKELQFAADHLGVDVKQLEQALLRPSFQIPGQDRVHKELNLQQAISSRDALSKALYGSLFLWVVRKINQVISHTSEQHTFIGVLDISGFEIFKVNSFEQLCINYTNEKLQQFFNHHMFTLEQEEYEREGIDWKFVDYGMDSQYTIDLIDKEPNGILCILDDQSVFPDADDTSFTKRCHETHKHHKSFRKPRFDGLTFKIMHYAGAVDYQTESWIEKNKDPLEDDLKTVCRNSRREFVRSLFDSALIKSNMPVASGTPSSGRKKGKAAAFNFVSRQHRDQLSHLMNTLRSTYPHFVRCIIPNLQKKQKLINDHLVLEQLACNGVLEGIRIARMGWPNRIKYADFVRRYYLLKPGTDAKAAQPKVVTEELVAFLAKNHPETVKTESIRSGRTKVFFRAGQLAEIEHLREDFIGKMIVSVQAASRAFLARREYNKFREQDIAAKTIQRNVRAWISLQNSLWYKLFVTARPFIKKVDLREKIEKLRQKKTALEKQLADLNAESVELTKQLQELEQKITQAADEMKAFNKQLFELEEEKENLQDEQESLGRKKIELEEGNQEESQTAQDLEENISSLKVAIGAAEQELEGLNKSADELGEKKSDLAKDRNEWLDKLDEIEIEVEGLVDKESKLRRELGNTEDQGSDAANVADTLRAKVQNVERSLAETQSQLEDVSAKRKALDSSKADLDAELAKSESELTALKNSIDKHKSDARKKKVALQGLKEQKEGAAAKVTALERANKDARSRTQDLEEELEDLYDLQRKQKEAESQAESLELAQGSAKKSLGIVNDQVKQLETQKEEALVRLDEAEATNGRLKQERSTKVAELEQQLDAEKERAAQEKRKLNRKATQLQDEAAEAANNTGANEEDIKALKDQLETANAQLEALDAAKDEADKKTGESKAESDQQKADLEAVDEENAALEGRNRSLKDELTAAQREADNEERARSLVEAENRRLLAEISDLTRKTKATAGGHKKELALHHQKENASLKGEMSELEDENNELRQAVRDAKEELNKILRQSAFEVSAQDRLTTGADEMKKFAMMREMANSELISMLTSSYENEKANLEAEIADFEARNKVLEDALTGKSNRYSAKKKSAEPATSEEAAEEDVEEAATADDAEVADVAEVADEDSETAED